MNIKAITISSLDKVFWDDKPNMTELVRGSALRGERYSFQVACSVENAEKAEISAFAISNSQINIEVYEVGVVPVTFPTNSLYDAEYLRTTPGLYPDPLYPHEGSFYLAHGQWRCLWITLVVPEDCDCKSISIQIELCNAEKNDERYAKLAFDLEVINAVLPKQQLIHTEWFYLDCLASYYKVPVFSSEHWKIVKNYMLNAAQFGVNMILTPVLTPPLDTQVGGERPTVQLVDIKLEENRYVFDFTKLKQFIDLAEECGIGYFEMSHLFTQWGAAHAPKVIAEVNGETKKIFGWETDSASEEYVSFLKVFLKELRN